MPTDPRAPLTFVCYRLDVAAGMERAFARVAGALARDRDVHVVVLRGRTVAAPIAALLGDVRVDLVSTGAYRARVRSVRRARDGSTVIVGAWAALLAPDLWLSRPRVMVWEHTLLRERLPYYPTLRRAFPVLARLYRRSGSVVCVSRSVRDFVAESIAPPRTAVIPNIVDACDADAAWGDGAAPRDDDGALRLLSTQRMVPVKHVELAVQCLAHLPDSATLVCAGDGPRRRVVESLAATSGLGARVEFPGHVDDVGSLLAQADVLLHTAYSETFGLSLVEAAARGVPVTCLAGGALAEMVPEYAPGVVVSDPSPRAFADGVLRAAGLRGDTARFAASAERRAETFGEAPVLEQWHAELDRIGRTAAVAR